MFENFFPTPAALIVFTRGNKFDVFRSKARFTPNSSKMKPVLKSFGKIIYLLATICEIFSQKMKISSSYSIKRAPCQYEKINNEIIKTPARDIIALGTLF